MASSLRLLITTDRCEESSRLATEYYQVVVEAKSMLEDAIVNMMVVIWVSVEKKSLPSGPFSGHRGVVTLSASSYKLKTQLQAASLTVKGPWTVVIPYCFPYPLYYLQIPAQVLE
jgi:hypothetical protein